MKKPVVKSVPATSVAPAISHDPALFDQLTAREQVFVMHPEVMKNPVKAALDAGFAQTTAETKAHRMRKQLMYFIRPVTLQRLAESGVSLKRVQDELAAIAFAVETDYFDTVDAPGDTIVVPKDPMRLPEHMRRAIKSIQLVNTIESGGVTFQTASIELYEKVPALKMLAEMLGGFDPKSRTPDDAIARRRQAELFDFMTADELKLVSKIYSEAEKRRTLALQDKVADKTAIEGEIT